MIGAGGQRAVGERPSRPVRLAWLWLIPIAAGLILGTLLGSRHTWVDSASPPSDPFSQLGVLVLAAAIVGGLGLLGVVFLVPRSTRRGGQALLVVAGCLVVGWPLGSTFGPRWQPPRLVPGQVSVQLSAPAVPPLVASASCATEANGDRPTSSSRPAAWSSEVRTSAAVTKSRRSRRRLSSPCATLDPCSTGGSDDSGKPDDHDR